MAFHNLKSWLALFRAHQLDLMPFEYRKNDRNYHPGDILHLEEYNQYTGTKTGRTLDLFVREIWTSSDIPGLPEDFLIMWVGPERDSAVLEETKRILNKNRANLEQIGASRGV